MSDGSSRRTCPTDGGYCCRISRSRSRVSCALCSSTGVGSTARSVGCAGRAGAGRAGCAARASVNPPASSAATSTSVFVITPLYTWSPARWLTRGRITPMFRPISTLVAVMALFAPLVAQSKLDPDVNAKIRQEENAHSKIMHTLHMLTDVYGPRVTGSPSLKAAGEWAIREMASWGFSDGHLEPWDFGHPGWVNERFTGHIVSPVKDQLTAEVVAWTPGTDGTETAQAFQLMMPER